jgi:hypothetical protein
MIKRTLTALGLALGLITALGTVGTQAATPQSATGTWSIRYAGNPMAVSKVVLHQQGQIVVGTYGNGYTLRGNVNSSNPLQIDATWQNPADNTTGWATLIFSPDWKTFSGRWGAPGRQPAGTFVASRVYIQINTTGKWAVTLTGQQMHQGTLTFQQTGTSFVGTWPKGGHITGSIGTGQIEVRGTWQTANAAGPIDLTFTADGNSFQGTWGYPGQPPKGRVMGTRIQ